MEATLNCVSEVTEADRKKRAVRFAARHVAHKLGLGKLMLCLAGAIMLGMPAFGLTNAPDGQAQPAAKTGIEDTWQGTLHTPQKDLRTVLKITKTDAGALKVMMYSIDQGAGGITASSSSFADGQLKYGIEMIDGTYEGKISSDGKSITGTWKQGTNPLSLVFERATPETAWAIPEPPPRLPPMAADADPTFEVATVKPSKPDQPGKALMVRGNRFSTINTTLSDLICFAYDVQQKQIVGAPDWITTDKFDIAAQPDVPGTPSQKQLKSMLQKLLADRFQLKFHRDKKELSAYILSAGKNGPKMKQNDGNPNGLPGLFFRQLGYLTVQNATMADFARLMQSAVLDRPVVDQTGLQGRWDFVLKWTPDESQFSGMGAKVPPPTDAADAPPPLFTAIQEQIGLKLDAGKAPVEVLALDHVDKPSEN
jgi:bla regulator protein blaR1